MPKKNLKSFFKFRLLKTKNIEYPFWRFDKEKNIELIKKGGWHFTYLMKPVLELHWYQWKIYVSR